MRFGDYQEVRAIPLHWCEHLTESGVGNVLLRSRLRVIFVFIICESCTPELR
jgi:hypothetical protein